MESQEEARGVADSRNSSFSPTGYGICGRKEQQLKTKRTFILASAESTEIEF